MKHFGRSADKEGEISYKGHHCMMHHHNQLVEQSPPGKLYQQYAASILSYLDRHVSIKEDAEDVLLEVFLAALENQTWVNLNDGERLAWLRRVARNKLVDHYRRVSRHPVAPLQELAETVADEDLSPEQQALFQESLGLLKQEIAALPRLQQEVLRLRFGHGLHTKEIASMLQRTDTAIRIMLSRILNRLHRAYDQQRGN
jgi:RNA polymerase sigma factor (sigma-70 family)